MNLGGYSRVLVVEDEAVVRHFMAASLRTFGFKAVREATDGKQALAILSASAVDLIVCDWHMPVMDGMKLLRSVRSDPLWNLIPFILLSADTDTEAAMQAVEEGADAFLFKPLHFENFEKCIQDVIDRRSALMEVWVSLARAAALADAGVPGEARAELEKAQGFPPAKAFVWVEAGRVEETLGDAAAAERSYRKALEIDRGFLRAYDQLFHLFTRQNRLDDARQALQAALNVRPQNSERHRAMATLCMTSGDETAARESLQRAVASHRSQAARHSAAAEFFMEHGRADLASQEFASALEADPGNLHYFNRMGIALRREQRYAEAVANYLRAIKLAPTDPVLYYNLARAYLGQGQRPQAEAALRRALLAEPNFQEAERLLKDLSDEKCSRETG